MAFQEEANARASDLTARTLVHHLSSALIKAAVDLDLISVQAKADQDSAHLDVDKALAPVDKAQEEDEASDPIAKVLEALVRDKEMIHGTTTAMMTTGAVIMEVRFYFVLKKLI